ncbi:MAG: SCP2 sterol-binding domain-containing protein [Myxococcota bacterium]|nr:SCP2 sterol-binding domain-containing protein [Myxococcales bacterium]
MSGDARAFYTERLPAQVDRALDDARAHGDAPGSLWARLREVDAAIEARVGDERYFLAIEAGRMRATAAPAAPPFLTIVHEGNSFGALERAAGDSALGFLGAVAGLGRELRLTKRRVDELRRVEGCVGLTVRGEGGFALRTHFGSGAPPDEAHCRIALDADVFAALRAGETDAESAFLAGRVDIEGDVQKAMQLAVAILADD